MEISYRKRAAALFDPSPCLEHFLRGRLCSFACFLTVRDQRKLCRKQAGQKHPTEGAERLANPKGGTGLRSTLRRRELRAGRAPQSGGLAQTKAWRDPPSASLSPRHSQVSALVASAAAAALALSPSFGVRLKKPLRSARPFTVRLRISSIAVLAEAASWRTAGEGSRAGATF